MKNWWRKQGVVAAAAAGNGEAARVVNPYLNARQEWNSQTERAFSQLHVWQLFGVAGLLVGLAGVAGIAYVGSKSKYVPYVIEVDKLGEVAAVGPAQLAAPADPRVVRASLASFISSARLVTPDVELERKAVFVVYGMVKQKIRQPQS
jgi:type IV secretion system protein VirB5